MAHWIAAISSYAARTATLRKSSRRSTELTSDGLVEVLAATTADDQIRYRLPVDEPTSVVLKRLIDSATHSLELRAIIAAQLQHLRLKAQDDRTASTAAA